MVFKAYTAGLPEPANELIKTGLETSFGDVELVTVSTEDIARIHEASRDDLVVFVCFDNVVHSRCKDFENGLYESGKYLEYTSNKSLVEFLNNHYETGLEVPEEETEYSEETSGPDLSSYDDENEELSYVREGLEVGNYDTNEGADKLIISNLQATITELEDIIDSVGYSQDDSNKVFDLESQVKSLTTANEILEQKNKRLNTRLTQTSSRLTTIEGNYKKLKEEHSEREGAYTQQTSKLTRMETELADLRSVKSDYKDLKTDYSDIKTKYDSLNSNFSSIQLQLNNKEGEVRALENRINAAGNKEEEVRSLTTQIEGYRKSQAELEERVSAKDREIERLSKDLNDTGELDSEFEELEGDLEKAEDEKSSLEIQVTSLNSKLLEANSRIEELESFSTEKEVNTGDIEQEHYFKYGIFGSLKETAYPKTPPPSLDLDGLNLKNVVFVFSGSGESSIDTYKQIARISEKFSSLPGRGLVVDLSNETNADYVFHTPPKKGVSDWLENGGPISSRVVTAGANKSVDFISLVGEGFFNESYLLSVDWAARLQEINSATYNKNSEEGTYKSIVYLGDISSTVGRVLFNSIAGLGVTRVYATGTPSSMRTLHKNLSGLPSRPRTRIYIYDYLSTTLSGMVLDSLEKLAKSKNYTVKVDSTINRRGGGSS